MPSSAPEELSLPGGRGFAAPDTDQAVSAQHLYGCVRPATIDAVTPDMPSPLTDPGDMQSSGPETYKAGGVLDRDALAHEFSAVLHEYRTRGYGAENPPVEVALADLALALVRPVAGVTLSLEEADDVEAVLQLGLDMDSARGPRLSALAARLEAARG